jgi:hypothetical protein
MEIKNMDLCNLPLKSRCKISGFTTWKLLIIIVSFPVLSCVKSGMTIDTVPEMEKDSMPFLVRQVAGVLENKQIDEASGLAASVSMPGKYWAHNDSGDSARMFLINETGAHVAEVRIKGAENRDWEDITTYKHPENQRPVIIMGDIGDNLARYDYGILYVIYEPAGGILRDTAIDFDRKLIFRYPDGPRDAETLMADPLTGDLYIVSKRESAVGLYRIAYPYPSGETIVAEKIMALPLTQIVAGDISTDGREILLKNYDFVYYFLRKQGETIRDALSRPAIKLPYTREPQGESVCFSKDGKSYFTVSETTAFMIPPVLYRYDRK